MILIERCGIRNFECNVFIWGNNASGTGPSLASGIIHWLYRRIRFHPCQGSRFSKYIPRTELRDGKVVQYKSGLTADRIQLVSRSKMWFVLDQFRKKQYGQICFGIFIFCLEIMALTSWCVLYTFAFHWYGFCDCCRQL